MTAAILEVDILRVDADAGFSANDVAAAEEPLELRLGGQPFVVIMRTPGADRQLATGFLLSEQIVRAGSEIASLRYCQDDDGQDAVNVLSAWLRGDAAARAQAALRGRRHVTANSSCGVCGRRSIDDLLASTRRLEGGPVIGRDVLLSLPERLRTAQRAFDQTGGLHAAGLFDANGTLWHAAEDVGRHNAVDKVIGAAVTGGELPLTDRVLFVSGRTSFEIVQKAIVAGVAVVASVSAPSSLAIDLARESGVTLAGFVRGSRFNIYAHPERIAL